MFWSSMSMPPLCARPQVGEMRGSEVEHRDRKPASSGSAFARHGLQLALAIAAAALYAPNLADSFIGDDFDLIRSFHGKPFSYLVSLLWSNESGDVWKDWGLDPAKGLGYLRPVKIWLLALDSALWGTNPIGYHVTATLCFVAMVVAAARLLERLLPDHRVLAVAGAGVAMMHPICAEIVPFLTAREETLAIAFGLAALLAFIRSRDDGNASPAFALLLALALGVKESSVAIVALAASHDLVHGRMRPWSPGFRSDARIWWPALIVLVLYFSLRWFAFGSFAGGDGSEMSFLPAQVIGFHARLFASLLDPTLLSVGFVREAGLVFALLALAPAIAVAWQWKRIPIARRRDLLFIGPLWYLATTALYAGVPFASRHHIFPVLGLVMAETVALATLLDLGALRRERRVALAFLALGALAFLPPSITTIREYRHASRMVAALRADIEAKAQQVPDGSDLVLRGVPQLVLPPFYFGWGLRSALGTPFTPSDVAGRMTVLNPLNRELNRIAKPVEEIRGVEIDVGRSDAIPRWMKLRYRQREIRENANASDPGNSEKNAEETR